MDFVGILMCMFAAGMALGVTVAVSILLFIQVNLNNTQF